MLTITLSGCLGPRLEVLSEKLTETSVKTQRKDDYSITYSVRVRNKCMAGTVRAMAQLYHLEGTFHDEQVVSFKSGKAKTLSSLIPSLRSWVQ